MKHAIAILAVLHVILSLAADAADPDWKARYAQLKQEELKNFKKTVVKGKPLTVALANGQKITGVLTGLTDQGVILSIRGKYHSIPRTKLGTDSRVKLFAADYAHIKAMARVKKEQEEYKAKTGGKTEDARAQAKGKKHPGYVVASLRQKPGHMHGRITMNGTVKNRTGVPLQKVHAYITLRDANGVELGTYKGPIESETLPPDTMCAFEVTCHYNKRTAGSQLSFKTGDGQELEVRYHE